MKKVISVLLCIAMLFISFSLVSFAADDDMKIIVANDLHLSAKSYKPYTGNTQTNAWAHVASSGQLIIESNAIITAFLEKAGASDADFVLLPGDLVDTGSEEEHLLMAAKLTAFENETGKAVFVVPGNHDFFKSDLAFFKATYSAFGFGEAIAENENNASYVAELSDDFRLLAIDSTIPGESKPEIDADELNWIKTQLEKAKADGKKVIAMMHHNLVEHFILADMIHSSAVVPSAELAGVLADGGVKYIFTGHTHDQDIASYTSASGNVIYDVVTNTLNAYPCVYREVTFGKSVVFKAEYVDEVDTSLIPVGLSEEAMALAESNFAEYSKKTMWTGLRNTFTSYTNAKTLINLLGIDPETDADMARIITSLGDKLSESLQMPFYSEDGNNLSELAAKYNKTLPESEYTDLIDLAITLYQAHCVGDEYYPANSTEIQLLMNGVSTVLAYCLEDVSAEDYAAVLKFVVTWIGADVPEGLLGFAGSTMERIEGIDMVVTVVLRPFVAEFTTDSSPEDNNVTLEGYEKLSGFEAFIKKIGDFFRMIFDFFKKIFSFVPMA